jgi:predicted N-acetyltransferase YhbS
LTYEAFLTLDYPGRRRMDEHYLIHLLRGCPLVIPQLCFVAERDGEIVGHILYAKTKFKRPDSSEADTVTFGPLSVLPKNHKQGIGKALVFHSIAKAKEMGFGAVLITGVPDYYPKLGFKRASESGLGIADDYSENHALMTDAFMTYELIPGYLNGGGMFHSWPAEYDQAENDDVGYAAFHKQFMAEHFPENEELA